MSKRPGDVAGNQSLEKRPMQRREFLQTTAAAGLGFLLTTAGCTPSKPLKGKTLPETIPVEGEDKHIPLRIGTFMDMLWRDNDVIANSQGGHNIYSVLNMSRLLTLALIDANGGKGRKLLALEIKHENQSDVDSYLRDGNLGHLKCLDNCDAPESLKAQLQSVHQANLDNKATEQNPKNRIDVLCMDETGEGDRVEVNASWVKRITNAHKSNAYDKILVMGGAYHFCNPESGGSRKGKLVDDVDEMLEKSLGKHVVHLHVGQYNFEQGMPGIYKGITRANTAPIDPDVIENLPKDKMHEQPDYVIHTVGAANYKHVRDFFASHFDTINSFSYEARKKLTSTSLDTVKDTALLRHAAEEIGYTGLAQQCSVVADRARQWIFNEATANAYEKLSKECAKLGEDEERLALSKDGKKIKSDAICNHISGQLDECKKTFSAAHTESKKNRDYWAMGNTRQQSTAIV